MELQPADDPEFRDCRRRSLRFFLGYLYAASAAVTAATVFIYVHEGPPPIPWTSTGLAVFAWGFFAVEPALTAWWVDRHLFVLRATAGPSGVELETKAEVRTVRWDAFAPKVGRDPRWSGGWATLFPRPRSRWTLTGGYLKVTPSTAREILARPEASSWKRPEWLPSRT